MTDIAFTEDELHLLDNGLKYNLHSKPKTWIKPFALEVDSYRNITRRKPDLHEAISGKQHAKINKYK
jgi:hypothetical protein